MNWLDIVLAIFLIISFLVGLKIGLIKAVFSLAGLVLAVFLAGSFYHSLADKLTFVSENAAAILAYVIIFILVMLIVSVIAWFLHKLAAAIMMGWINHLGGALAGFLVGCLFLGAILALWTKYSGGSGITGESAISNFLLDKFPFVLALLPNEFDTIRSIFQ